MPDGSLVHDYLQIAMPEHVVVIARSPDNKLLVQQQYKHGPRTIGLTFPAGAIEPGEEPSVAARRELLEETGSEASHWQGLGRFVLNGNQGAGAAHLFSDEGLSTNSSSRQATGDLEEQEIMWLTEDELIEAARRGQFTIISHALALAFALDRRLWPANSEG